MMDSTTKNSKRARREEIKFWILIIVVIAIVPFASDCFYPRKLEYTKMLKTGSLETSFCDIIPGENYFGISRQNIISSMKRKPDDRRMFKKDIEILSYSFDDIPHLGQGVIAFQFLSDELYTITIMSIKDFSKQENIDDYDKVVLNYKSNLMDLYGPPQILYHTYQGARDTVSEVLLWEFANNALIIFPVTVNEDNFGWFGTVVGPLSESGHYDLSYDYDY